MKRILIVTALALPLGCKTTDYATPEEKAKIEAGGPEGDATATSVAERVTGQVVDVVDPFIPAPVKPFVPLLAALFFKRPRRIVGKGLKGVGSAVKNVATLKPGAALTDVGETLEDVLRLVGLKDSRPDPNEKDELA